MENDSLRKCRVANHEAGHSVVAWLEGAKGRASICQSQIGDEWLGSYQQESPTLISPTCAVAGIVGEAIFDPLCRFQSPEEIFAEWWEFEKAAQRLRSLSEESRRQREKDSDSQFGSEYQPTIALMPSGTDVTLIPNCWRTRRRLVRVAFTMLSDAYAITEWFRDGLLDFGSMPTAALDFGDTHGLERKVSSAWHK